ncbi:MAG: tRNA (5-methylaminomethyl-2-thiouridine)(34)-methyltransferase MnmD [Bacteroidales bacterium]|nr:tRNA (5-methylaminomethyl-2-thiouridine)(34)-methyltransferase MnmD [Bacteroidales bacterium]
MNIVNKTLARELIITDDGSHSICVPELDESYHSSHGAIQEARHIYIKDALVFSAKHGSNLNVLEIGFGTGLNTFLSYQYALENGLRIHYHGVEKYPLLESEYSQLNYSGDENSQHELFLKLHQSDWEREEKINDFFTLYKEQKDIRLLQLPDNFYDVVYFDAFGPDVQPDLWSEKVFRKIFHSMKEGAVMTTYSVKGQVRRVMKTVGFSVEKIPGPSGKREITRAVKTVNG